MTERASATYLGIRTLASIRISSTSSRKNISRLGERGIPCTPPETVIKSPKGKSCNRNSCAATYSAGRKTESKTAKVRKRRFTVARAGET